MSVQMQNLISWIVIGLIAGFVASLFVGGGGGVIGWLVAGLLGSVVGGFLAQQFKIDLKLGNPFLERLIIAFGGAIVVLIVANIIT